MNKIAPTLNNEKGFAIVVAILFLALLTIIGISATDTSTTELKISTNDHLHKMAFVTAESGWQVGVNWLDSQSPLITADFGMDTSSGAIDFSAAKYPSPDNFSLGAANSCSAVIAFDGVEFVLGYSSNFMRHKYTVSSSGTGPRGAVAQVVVSARKIGHVGGY